MTHFSTGYLTKTAAGELVTNHGPGIMGYMTAKLEAISLELFVVVRKRAYSDERITYETLHDYTRKEPVK